MNTRDPSYAEILDKYCGVYKWQMLSASVRQLQQPKDLTQNAAQDSYRLPRDNMDHYWGHIVLRSHGMMRSRKIVG